MEDFLASWIDRLVAAGEVDILYLPESPCIGRFTVSISSPIIMTLASKFLVRNVGRSEATLFLKVEGRLTSAMLTFTDLSKLQFVDFQTFVFNAICELSKNERKIAHGEEMG